MADHPLYHTALIFLDYLRGSQPGSVEAGRRYEAMAAAARGELRVPRWVPVEEGLPAPFIRVVVLCENDPEPAIGWWTGAEWVILGAERYPNVRAWADVLPAEIPKEES